jgi:hypothetical protein
MSASQPFRKGSGEWRALLQELQVLRAVVGSICSANIEDTFPSVASESHLVLYTIRVMWNLTCGFQITGPMTASEPDSDMAEGIPMRIRNEPQGIKLRRLNTFGTSTCYIGGGTFITQIWQWYNWRSVGVKRKKVGTEAATKF